MGFGKSVQRSFIRGLAALLPALLTFMVLVFGIKLVHEYIGQYVNSAIVGILAGVLDMPIKRMEDWYSDHFLTWLGSVVAIILLCAVAYVLGTFIGGRLIRWLERWIIHLPILRKIYPGAKQVSDFFFSARAAEFHRVVAIEFPRKGVWMIGFVTGRGLQAITAHTGIEMLSVFIPFTPAPVTGYVVEVSRNDVVDLDLSVDEAIQFLISAGVIMPAAERAEALAGAVKTGHVQNPAPTAPDEPKGHKNNS